MLSFGFRIFCWYRGFCHRTWSDLLLFLSTKLMKIIQFKQKKSQQKRNLRIGKHTKMKIIECKKKRSYKATFDIPQEIYTS